MSDLIKRPTPVGTPSLDDMPLTQSVPVCEWNSTNPDGVQCTHAATLRVRSHISDRQALLHGDIVALMCAEHFDGYRQWWEDLFASRSRLCCGTCEKPYRHISDAILSVIPL